jgi:hypothetical protein
VTPDDGRKYKLVLRGDMGAMPLERAYRYIQSVTSVPVDAQVLSVLRGPTTALIEHDEGPAILSPRKRLNSVFLPLLRRVGGAADATTGTMLEASGLSPASKAAATASLSTPSAKTPAQRKRAIVNLWRGETLPSAADVGVDALGNSVTTFGSRSGSSVNGSSSVLRLRDFGLSDGDVLILERRGGNRHNDHDDGLDSAEAIEASTPTTSPAARRSRAANDADDDDEASPVGKIILATEAAATITPAPPAGSSFHNNQRQQQQERQSYSHPATARHGDVDEAKEGGAAKAASPTPVYIYRTRPAATTADGDHPTRPRGGAAKRFDSSRMKGAAAAGSMSVRGAIPLTPRRSALKDHSHISVSDVERDAFPSNATTRPRQTTGAPASKDLGRLSMRPLSQVFELVASGIQTVDATDVPRPYSVPTTTTSSSSQARGVSPSIDLTASAASHEASPNVAAPSADGRISAHHHDPNFGEEMERAARRLESRERDLAEREAALDAWQRDATHTLESAQAAQTAWAEEEHARLEDRAAALAQDEAAHAAAVEHRVRELDALAEALTTSQQRNDLQQVQDAPGVSVASIAHTLKTAVAAVADAAVATTDDDLSWDALIEAAAWRREREREHAVAASRRDASTSVDSGVTAASSATMKTVPAIGDAVSMSLADRARLQVEHAVAALALPRQFDATTLGASVDYAALVGGAAALERGDATAAAEGGADDGSSTCSIDLPAAYIAAATGGESRAPLNVLFTVDTDAHRLYMFAALGSIPPPPLPHQLPSSSAEAAAALLSHYWQTRALLHEQILEGALLSRETAGGSIGVNAASGLALMSCAFDLDRSAVDAAASVVMGFVVSAATWAGRIERAAAELLTILAGGNCVAAVGHSTGADLAAISTAPAPSLATAHPLTNEMTPRGAFHPGAPHHDSSGANTLRGPANASAIGVMPSRRVGFAEAEPRPTTVHQFVSWDSPPTPAGVASPRHADRPWVRSQRTSA